MFGLQSKPAIRLKLHNVYYGESIALTTIYCFYAHIDLTLISHPFNNNLSTAYKITIKRDFFIFCNIIILPSWNKWESAFVHFFSMVSMKRTNKLHYIHLKWLGDNFKNKQTNIKRKLKAVYLDTAK